MSTDRFANYKRASSICKCVYKEIVEKIKNGERNVKHLCEYGNMMILQKCGKNDSVAIPVCISLNNCIGYYVYEEKLEKYNTISDNDVIKIEFGVNCGGKIVILGETLVIESDETHSEFLKLLEDITQEVVKLVKHGETNDEIRMMVESKCTELGCFPVENCIGYQQIDGKMKTQESKYIVFNHRKYWDDNDNLAVEENLCFELEEGEVYNINLTIVPDREHVYKEKHKSHICMFNDYFVSLRTRSGKTYLAQVKKKYKNDAFVVSDTTNTALEKFGFRECYEKGLLEEFPVLYVKDGSNVYHKKFTIVVLQDKCVKF